jgi:hypothetical protein
MGGHGHSVGKGPTGIEGISRKEGEFAQLLGRRFHTVKDSDD